MSAIVSVKYHKTKEEIKKIKTKDILWMYLALHYVDTLEKEAIENVEEKDADEVFQ